MRSAQQPPTGDSTPLRDRSTGLVAVGAVVIVVGLLCALMVPVTWFASTWSAAASGEAAELRVSLSVMAFYGLLAAALVVLGVGSMRARRWACELLLALSRIWLLTGICTLLLSLLIVPRMVEGAVLVAGADPLVTTIVTLVVLAVVAATQVALPAGLVLFYGSADVAATCRAYDVGQDVVWEAPRPVLTLAAVWALTGASVLVMPAYNLVFPCFGTLLRGADAILPWVAVMASCLALALGTARRALWAWWGGVSWIAAAAGTTIVTSLRVDAAELLEALRLRTLRLRDPPLAGVAPRR